MRASFPKHRKFFQMTCLGLLAAVLVACGSTPTGKSSAEDTSMGKATYAEDGFRLPWSEFSTTFRAAEEHLADFDWMSASGALSDLPTDQMSPTDNQYKAYLQARVHYLRGEQDEALELLEQLKRSPIDPAIGRKADNFHRHLLSMAGQPLKSAELGHTMLQRGSIDQATQDDLVRDIWRDLQRVSPDALEQAINRASDPQWAEWLSLSLMTSTATSAPQLQSSLNRWLAEHPGGWAPGTLPGGLDYLLEQDYSVQKVVLMLPLSGRLAPAAKAVRDGYLANYYTARDKGAADYELQVVDLDRYESVLQAYEEAVMAGASLVIGPLSKDHVAALGNYPNRTVPILALNRADAAMPVGTTAIVQLALAPEDEAIQVAELAFGNGSRRALIVRPTGNWGSKMERALTEHWKSLGGQVGSVANYSGQEDYSSSMASALNLADSEQRARDVRSMLATNLEFTARRRQDIDVVFLLSRTGAEARSLKPLLAYHYAGDLPVYATSSIYRGLPDSRDKDLNGIQLLEIPWLLDENSQLRSIVNTGGTSSPAYTRLNALGADAYLLQTRFSQLQGGPDVYIRGSTGLLSLDPSLKIRRELHPAKFDGGTLRSD